ncbi:YibE/F family protein [Alkaliphilus sp. B6464]|uniref:YibE/F family protein n=1 Tax=Alkaliphilus sp. B6464 TaxID=2731219 RepID=UPI001BAC8DC9|nr:YibE/F family protein [Alkaliphilus sp. B6464]QUH20190.1 YibE/F family protein [Alkaliphilus sp. B6464]
MKKFILILVALLIIISPSTFSYAEGEIGTTEQVQSELVKAKILNVEQLENDPDNPIFTKLMMVKVEILNGEYKGEQFEIPHNLTGSYGYDIDVEPGDKVLVTVEKIEDGSVEVYISEHLRDTYVYIVAAIFVALILIIGRVKGLKTIITLILTILLVLKGLLPGLLAGYNPILLTIGIAFIITVVTILTVGGINRKSYAAIIGVLGGVFVAGLIAYVIGSKVKLTGLSSEEAVMLMYIPQGIKFDFKGLLFAGIIMGALGAVMDVGMSISSSMEEIKNADPTMSTKTLIMSGMNVGKDIMGTMANTLILAYTGSSIPLLLLFTAYGEDFTKIINLDIIATEIIRAFAGSIGLILCIPLTALVAGVLMEKHKTAEENITDMDKI